MDDLLAVLKKPPKKKERWIGIETLSDGSMYVGYENVFDPLSADEKKRLKKCEREFRKIVKAMKKSSR